MATYDPAQHPRDDDGRFSEKAHTPPDIALPQTLVWVVEGDDHEVVLVEAETAAEALDSAAAEFSAHYDEPYSRDLLTIGGSFRGDADDIDSLVFVPSDEGQDERTARRMLEYAEN